MYFGQDDGGANGDRPSPRGDDCGRIDRSSLRTGDAGSSDRDDTSSRGLGLVLRGVGKRFGGVQAIADVDMDVEPGEIHAIIGPNGAGKTTLLNLISGLTAPDAGTIRFGGSDRAPRARDLSRLGIARTFQNLALFDGLDVARNVALGCSGRRHGSLLAQVVGSPRTRRDRQDTRRRVDEALAFLGLEAFAGRRLEGLPYGVRKRVELARALVAEPRVLLLDEPLAGMTDADKPEMARLVRATRDRFGTTIVLIEHEVSIVMHLADRITVLDGGRRIATGTPATIRRHPAVIAAYLGGDAEDDAA